LLRPQPLAVIQNAVINPRLSTLNRGNLVRGTDSPLVDRLLSDMLPETGHSKFSLVKNYLWDRMPDFSDKRAERFPMAAGNS